MNDESKTIFSTGAYILGQGTSNCSVGPRREPSPRIDLQSPRVARRRKMPVGEAVRLSSPLGPAKQPR